MADDLLRDLGRRHIGADADVNGDGDSTLASANTGETERAGDSDRARPFDTQESEEILDAVFDRLDRNARSATRSIDEKEGARFGTPVRLPVRLQVRMRRSWMAASGLAAVAAALAVVVSVQQPSAPGSPALPDYVATEFGGGTTGVRSGAGALGNAVTVAPDDAISWVFTPRSPVHDDLAIAWRAWPADPATVEAPSTLRRFHNIEVSPDGAVRIRGRMDEVLNVGEGVWNVEFLIGRSVDLPSEVPTPDHDGPRPWQSLTLIVTVRSHG